MTASPSTTQTGRVYHVCTADAWAAEAEGEPVATRQFERHGFVHCCFREQITEIATWWFAPADHLVALEIDPHRLRSQLRVEASPSRWHPHVYGPIDATSVVAVHALERMVDGVTALPPRLRRPPPGYQVTGVLEDAERTVRWRADGTLHGDRAWIAAAEDAISGGATVELVGGIVALATLAGAYESFALLAGLLDDGTDVVRYDGDGFFAWD